jgi:hypothetical protein
MGDELLAAEGSFAERGRNSSDETATRMADKKRHPWRYDHIIGRLAIKSRTLGDRRAELTEGPKFALVFSPVTKQAYSEKVIRGKREKWWALALLGGL